MDDEMIVDLYWNRDENAISVSIDKYGNYCRSIAINILGNTEDSEECVNDTFLRAWNSIPPHRPAILSAFLGKITRNLALNRYKYNTATKRGNGLTTDVLDEIAGLVSDTESVERELDRKAFLCDIENFLDGISAEKRCIFINRYWYFESVADIAARFGMSENNVSVTLNRLRTKLRKYLSERGYEF